MATIFSGERLPLKGLPSTTYQVRTFIEINELDRSC